MGHENQVQSISVRHTAHFLILLSQLKDVAKKVLLLVSGVKYVCFIGLGLAW